MAAGEIKLVKIKGAQGYQKIIAEVILLKNSQLQTGRRVEWGIETIRTDAEIEMLSFGERYKFRIHKSFRL